MSQLELLLCRLRGLGLCYRAARDLRAYEAVCPVCRTGVWGLSLRERYSGHVSLRCSSGCDEGLIRWTLSEDPLTTRVAELEERLAEALELAEDSRQVAERALELTTARLQAPTVLAVAA